jgi:hypothetical protein
MIRKSVAEILDQHVTFELEAIDRMYLNGYVPSLQSGGGVVYFMKQHLGARVPSTTMVAPLSERFVRAIDRFVETAGLDLVTFQKGQRKDDVAQEYLASFTGEEGVLFVGKAQEKASVFRTEKRRRPDGSTYPWIYRSTTPVNHYYFYILDRDFGPLFIKVCSYFPYAVKVCLNWHEWLKRQLTQRGIAYEPLDNGIGPPRTPRACSGPPTPSMRPRSTPCSANGSVGCRIPSLPPTARRAIAISSLSSKRNSP